MNKGQVLGSVIACKGGHVASPEQCEHVWGNKNQKTTIHMIVTSKNEKMTKDLKKSHVKVIMWTGILHVKVTEKSHVKK